MTSNWTDTMPRISVIIPTYNRCELLRKTVDSVLAQTFADFELIVVDDGSTDETRPMVEQYCRQYPDQVQYIYQQNAGESVARQHGVDISRGSLLAFLDSDDIWLPSKLEKQVQFLEQHGDAAYVYCWASVIDKHGYPVQWPVLGSLHDPAQFSLQELVLGNFIVGPGSTLLLRRRAYDACGGFNPQIQFAEDWDLCLRLGVNHRFGCVCEPLVEVRLYERGWHQRQENLPRMLRDHLSLVETFYKIPRIADSSLAQVKPRALANQYANAGFAHLIYGDELGFRACLVKACELAPEQWAQPELFMQAAANYAVSFLAPNHPVERAEHLIDRVAHTAPAIAAYGTVTHSRLRGWLYVTLAHHRWQLADCNRTRQYILRSMWVDPAWRRRRGLWSLFARSLLRQSGLRKGRRSEVEQQTSWLISLDSASGTLHTLPVAMDAST